MQSYQTRVPQLDNRISKLRQSLPSIECPTQQDLTIDEITNLLKQRENIIDENRKKISCNPNDDECEACQ